MGSGRECRKFVCVRDREKVEMAKGERTEKVTDSTEKGVREGEKVEIGV